MTQATVVAAGASAELSLPQRLLGVITSPRQTFEAIVAAPKWFGAWLVTTIVVFGAQIAFALTEVGRRASVDYQVSWAEAFGARISDQQYNQMLAQAANPTSMILGNVFGIAGAFVVFLVICGIAMGVFAIAGGQARFKQVMAVVAHAGIVQALSVLFVTPLNYVQESISGRTNLAVFLPMLPEESFLGRLLGMIDLIWIWYLVVLAIGLAVLYRRKPNSVATTFLGLYFVIVLVIAGVRSAWGGS